MTKPNFSIVMIAKNEAKTLPRCMTSLKQFTDRGGEVVLCDTGSTDGTAELARSLGCTVFEAGEKFIKIIDKETAEKMNAHFVVDDEAPIVKEGNRLFDFAAARNYATAQATNHMICTLDCDEAYSTLNIDKINDLIAQGYEQFEYQFVFAHDQYGRPAIQFVQSKFFDKRKIQWTGVVHEVLHGEGKRLLVGPDVIMLEHWQQPGGEHRGNYLVGLGLDCYLNPDKDRQSHYFAREMMWNGHPKSAIKEFERHIKMNRWPAERAQSMIHLGDCYGMLTQRDNQIKWYQSAFEVDPSRRESLIKLARIYRAENNPKLTLYYAKAALDIPWTDYYANSKAMYEQEPHELLYWAYGWLGDVASAQKHILKCLEYQPFNEMYQRDTAFYFEYPENGIKNSWMSFKEQTFLYNTGKQMESVIELGAWRGKSTHALCSSKCPKIISIDHWQGSKAEPEAHAAAREGVVYEDYQKNVGHFTNLTVVKKDINEAVNDFADGSVDVVFIDAGHTYEEVRNDIRKWKNKAKIMLCGHDYCDVWPGVIQAVDEELGGPDEIHDSIWVKWLHQPQVSICIPTLGRPEKLHRLLEKIKENAGYQNYEIVVKADEEIPNNIGAPKMLKKCVEASKNDLVMFLGNDCIPEKNFLREALFEMIRRFSKLDGMVGLNDGFWKRGELATHWLASKQLLPLIGGEFFHTGYNHVGCDNELQGRCEALGKYSWAEKAKLYHDHPVNIGWNNLDAIYQVAYKADRHAADQVLLKQRSLEYSFNPRI